MTLIAVIDAQIQNLDTVKEISKSSWWNTKIDPE